MPPDEMEPIEKYYIVCSNGVGDELRGYLEHPDKINTFVLDNWGKYCARKRQITKDGVVLTNELRAYIEKFDFSMVDEVSPETLIHQMESAKKGSVSGGNPKYSLWKTSIHAEAQLLLGTMPCAIC